jgi:hypothetical protein
MNRATIGIAVLTVTLAWACTGRSADFWKEAEPNGVVRVQVVSTPPGTSGKGGGTAVAYATDIELDQTIETYVEFFRARGVAPTLREARSAYFDSPKTGLCLDIQPWGQGVGFHVLSPSMSESNQARMAEAPGAYWILVPDDCSFAG